ncbi:hypothetical protein K7432_000214 [Basidiobolus ranarum]|uniref:HORMA domain-containing protein n=1 Tax=Basidiobolus ranarum TaxID=34480 RepID=A0ABR2WBJ5_9FUNG
MQAQAQQSSKQLVETQLPTEQQSSTLVKKLLQSSLGCITYLRALFPEENYFTENIGKASELSIKQIKRGFSAEGDTLIDWMEKGCYHALEKKYLRSVILGIYLDPNEPTNLAETYTFDITYPEEGETNITITKDNEEIMRFKSKGEIKKASQQLLRRLILLTQTLKPLPDNRFITMKLLYYDVAPSDYEPPLFRPEDPDKRFVFEVEPERIDIGEVETPYHSLNIKVATISDHFDDPEETDENSEIPTQVLETSIQDTQEITKLIAASSPDERILSLSEIEAQTYEKVVYDAENEECTRDSSEEISFTQATVPIVHSQELIATQDYSTFISEYSLTPNNTNTTMTSENLDTNRDYRHYPTELDPIEYLENLAHSKLLKLRIDNDELPSQVTSYQMQDEKKMIVQCVCGLNESDGDMIFCDYCGTWGHIVCFGFKSKDDSRIPDVHICYACKFSKDPELNLRYNSRRIESLAIWRHCLSIIWDEGLDSCPLLAWRLGINTPTARKLINRLCREGFLIKTKKAGEQKMRGKYSYLVVKNPEMEEILDRYFSQDLDVALFHYETKKRTNRARTLTRKRLSTECAPKLTDKLVEKDSRKKRKVSIAQDSISVL